LLEILYRRIRATFPKRGKLFLSLSLINQPIGLFLLCKASPLGEAGNAVALTEEDFKRNA